MGRPIVAPHITPALVPGFGARCDAQQSIGIDRPEQLRIAEDRPRRPGELRQVADQLPAGQLRVGGDPRQGRQGGRLDGLAATTFPPTAISTTGELGSVL